MPAAALFFVLMVIVGCVCRMAWVDGRDEALADFRNEWNANFRQDQKRIEDAFNVTYEVLRTMALLPGVSKIDRHATTFDGDQKTTVQQIYNNIALHVPVSEVYIVPADLDPDAIDPVTHKPQEPIISFDQIIVGRNGDSNGEKAETHEIEEVEIHEYRQMRAQNAYFREHFATRASIQGLHYPAASSDEVITCDNSQFTREALVAHDDSKRVGVVYSVPFYAPDGSYKGIVCAVMRTAALATMIENPYAVARRSANGYTLTPAGAAARATSEASSATNAFEQQGELSIVDVSPWQLSAAIPRSVLVASPVYKAAVQRCQMILIGGCVLSFAIASLVFSLYSTRARAIELARSMTADLATAKEAAETALREVSALRTALDQHSIVSITDGAGTILDVNTGFCTISGYTSAELIGKDHRIVNSGRHPKAFWTDVWRTIASGRPWRGEVCNRHKSGSEYWVDATIIPFKNKDGRIEKYVSIRFDITSRKKAEAARDELQSQFEQAARKAGMAEIATGVLHNVGNVLNSVNISATVVADKIKTSHVNNLTKAVGMMQEHRDNLGQFLTADNKGKLLPDYLQKLSGVLSDENESLITEMNSLFKSVEHMKQVISSQQSLAMQNHRSEPVDLVEAVDEAIRINSSSLDRHKINVVKNFRYVVPAVAEKHRVLQILINLLSNAKKAVKKNPTERNIAITMDSIEIDGQSFVRTEVRDNGIGIAAEDLPKIFQHGFTKSEGGHGFGLHTAAADARRMGGSLSVQSDGLGQGAAFVLVLPTERKVAVA